MTATFARFRTPVTELKKLAGGFMAKEDDVFDLAHLARSLANGGAAPPNEALTWYTPVRFDPGLLRKLLDQHDTLDARVASLPDRFRRDQEDAARASHYCAGQVP